ncbi:hypothetical protein DFP72DRAFT_1725 [Ephemerocybe angulata]|uniref:MARVEL domain-containing protein n=1 Tax=Ephemerocybe angulata TaxID=980116 RepID=A0A8H6ME24_9AGAR|nr:hypothetical protein DFP72DRAFT_1725 [Tulosesus angulatus]
MTYIEVHYHPLLFTTITLGAMAELGLTAYLINAGIETKSFTSDRYHALLGLFCFMSSWTMVFGASYMLWYFDRASHFLANVASSIAWLLTTGTIWGIAAGVMHITRDGGDCAGRPIISRCRQTLTLEALGWAEFGVCLLTTFATCFWIVMTKRAAKRSDSAARLV